MNIAYQCSEFFVGPLMVSITSLLSNNKGVEFRIFILSGDLSRNSLLKIRQHFLKLGGIGEINLIKIPDFKKEYGWSIDTYNGKWGSSSFVRLCLSSLLPKDIDRVLYLDSDILICHNLFELWNTNLDGFLAGGVADFLSKKYYDYFELGPNDIYCNSGVILFNLIACREFGLEKKVGEYLKAKNGFVFFVEQTVFNVVCKGKIKLLPFKYNVLTIELVTSSKQLLDLREPLMKYSQKEIDDSIKNYFILHMTTCFLVKNRAWYKNSNYPNKKVFDYYAQMTPFFSYYEDGRGIKKKLIDFVIHITPKTILCSLCGWYYQRIRLKKYIRYVKRAKGN